MCVNNFDCYIAQTSDIHIDLVRFCNKLLAGPHPEDDSAAYDQVDCAIPCLNLIVLSKPAMVTAATRLIAANLFFKPLPFFEFFRFFLQVLLVVEVARRVVCRGY